MVNLINICFSINWRYSNKLGTISKNNDLLGIYLHIIILDNDIFVFRYCYICFCFKKILIRNMYSVCIVTIIYFKAFSTFVLIFCFGKLVILSYTDLLSEKVNDLMNFNFSNYGIEKKFTYNGMSTWLEVFI